MSSSRVLKSKDCGLDSGKKNSGPKFLPDSYHPIYWSFNMSEKLQSDTGDFVFSVIRKG